MHKKVGLILILGSIILIASLAWSMFGVSYWLKPPHEKLIVTWTEDLANLEKAKKLPQEWSEIREINITPDTTPNSPISEWLTKVKAPIKLNPEGRFKLQTEIYYQIEGYRYGVSIQYHIEDIATKNTVNEFGRTYRLGFVY